MIRKIDSYFPSTPKKKKKTSSKKKRTIKRIYVTSNKKLDMYRKMSHLENQIKRLQNTLIEGSLSEAEVNKINNKIDLLGCNIEVYQCELAGYEISTKCSKLLKKRR